jgi:hypothetical protein
MEDTWWHRFISHARFNLVRNDSWSGSTIGYTGYENADCSQTSSFIYRYRKLKENGFFDKNKVDTIIVFGGTNDSWYNSPVGQIKHQDISQEDLKYVLPAFSYLIDRVKKESPNTKIYLIINTGLKEEIANGIKDIAEHFDQVAIELKDIDKIAGHPSRKGMTQIAEQILERL